MGEFIPGTKPEWGRKLPDGDLNSLVDSAGNNYDNGFNFDEKDDDVPEFDPEEAQKRANEIKNERTETESGPKSEDSGAEVETA